MAGWSGGLGAFKGGMKGTGGSKGVLTGAMKGGGGFGKPPAVGQSIWGGMGTYTNPLGAKGAGKGPRAPKPPKPKPATTPSAGAAGTTGGASGAAPGATGALQPSPYDATYWQSLNNATLAANQKIDAYGADISNGATALQNTLAQLKYNQGLATTKDQNAENARGGFAQGALGQQLGQLNHAYVNTASADAEKYAQQAAAWQQAITGVKSGLSAEQIALGLASAARAAANTAKDPAAGPGALPTTTAPAAATTSGGGGPPRVVRTTPERRSSRGGKGKGKGK